jgi:hypothetical protein
MKNTARLLNLKNKLSISLVLLTLLICIIPFSFAQVESFGTFKQNSAINLIQTYNATACNITSITAPDSSLLLTGVLMTKAGNSFTLALNSANTTQLGIYNVCGDCDTISWCARFEITPTGIGGGFTGTLGFYIIIVLLGIILVIWGYKVEDANITFFGGIIFVGLGLYTWIDGIAGIRDTTITYITAVVLIFFGAYILVRSAMEMLNA